MLTPGHQAAGHKEPASEPMHCMMRVDGCQATSEAYPRAGFRRLRGAGATSKAIYPISRKKDLTRPPVPS